MSHDTDKLIRQLSLVAFLMAERRPLTARDVKQNVEGYSEMSDEAFARRFYSDRAELLALGVPLDSQRDEFTGEELYTLRSERYFLPPLELTDEELAALQTCFYLLEGQFAYAEPLRLALQNLALGRPGFEDAPTATARAVELHDPGYSPELPGRLAKLEGAISKNRTVKFTYWSIMREDLRERTVNPYSLLFDRGQWYVVGLDTEADEMRTFRVSRIRGDIRLATRRERDFRLPPDFDADAYRLRPDWQVGEIQGEARVEVGGDTAWWVERAFGAHGSFEDGVFVTGYSDLGRLSSWILRQDGRAVPVAPPELRRVVRADLKLVQERHEGKPPRVAADAKEAEREVDERPASPVPPERFGLLQALLAYLLDRCGENAEAVVSAADIVERFHIPPESLEEHLQLLNLVNFGGGCYAVYSELQDGEVHVGKEIFGDAFRSPPRLTPLEARAIRLALEFVGPMIAADAHSPLDRVRRKLEETFGQFDLSQTAEPRSTRAEEKLVGSLSEGIRQSRLVEIEYQKEGEESLSTRVVEPHVIERELPYWYIHTWDRTRDAQRSFRLDRMRSARLLREKFEPRPGFEPERLGGAAVSARIWYSKKIARWKNEEGARPLTDGAARAEKAVGSEEWLIGEILADRGEAVLLEPENLRKQVARRAKALARELRLSRVAAKA
ncbi:MAG TPA: WYL domain-containing protein [Gaiellaceae bacterium]|jgi:proteasome accessory factor C|nr:WYL domain-containing protein [Gaiellaceae bacterium]